MSDLFGIARSGIKAYKESLATTGQNIANAGNTNYARREANHKEVKSSSADVLSVNSHTSYGVVVDGISRAFDEFIEVQLNNASSDLSSSTSQTLILEKLERILRPSDMTVSERLQNFFTSLSTVSEDASNLAARHIAVDAGLAVANSISTAAKGIDDLRNFVAENVIDNVRDFNNILKSVNAIQKEILGNASPKSVPNNLLDQRDGLINDLSKITAISVDYKSNGSVRITVGTSGQGQTLVDGLEVNQLNVQLVDDVPRIFLANGANGALSKIQVQSGEIAGYLAADITLTSVKGELDQLSRKLTSEFNELHRFGIDLNGNNGIDFFSLDAVKIEKKPQKDSNTQLQVEGFSDVWVNKILKVSFQAEEQSWSIADSNGSKLKEFKNSTTLDGLQFNLEGLPALGDEFTVRVSNNLSENLKVKLADGRQLAASSFYTVEPLGSNNSEAKIDLARFADSRNDDLDDLTELLAVQRNVANSVSFVSGGVLGTLEDLDSISDLTSLKSQAKIQYSVPIPSLDTNSKLKVTLGGVEHIFSLNTIYDQITDYSDLAKFLNNGGIKSDGNLFSFSDLGLHAGGNSKSLTISSAGQPPYGSYSKLTSGSLNNVDGIMIPSDEGIANLQIFTREGIQLTGKPLSEKEANELILQVNGFSDQAKYSAKYLTKGQANDYLGGEIKRLTTEGSHIASITAVGFSDNLNVYASNSFPTSRAGMSSEVTVGTEAGRSAQFSSEQGMMAGQIADKFNDEIEQFGITAFASNKVELLNIANGRIQFDLFGKNSEAESIDVTIANLDTSQLAKEINSRFEETGISASASGAGALVLFRPDGNDISIKNMALVSDISARQLDKFGESIQTTLTNISNGQHIVSGGQVELISPSSFNLIFNGVNKNSARSVFDDGFINKSNDAQTNSTAFSFYTSSLIDGNAVDENSSIPVAASASYGLTVSSDNSNSNISVSVKPRNLNDFSSGNIAKQIVTEIRKNSPKTKFLGDNFTMSDGYPPNGATFEFQLGEQKYVATLNIDVDYTVEGSNVLIGSETLSFLEGLERIVASSRFTVIGPEKDRVSVGFEKNGSNFRFFATAKDGVLSGHALLASSTNSASQKSNFHVSNSSTAEIISEEIDLTQADQTDFAKLVIGSASHSLSFLTAGDTITVSPALPAGAAVSLVSTGSNKAKIKIEINESITDKDVRLMATDNSSTFGIVTSSSQITLRNGDLVMSNYNNSRVVTSGNVSSLADEVISINNLAGEDLILVSSGSKKATIIGNVGINSTELNPREMLVKVKKNDPNLVDIFDLKSGDLIGSRSISSNNNFLFRGFDWQIDGQLQKADEFKVLTYNQKTDDASNLTRLIGLSNLAEDSGRGGYSNQFNDLVTTAGFHLRAGEQNLVNSNAIYEVALDRKSEFSGVDLDTEAANLLEQQQAYQALARVLTTAKEMLDTLLRSI